MYRASLLTLSLLLAQGCATSGDGLAHDDAELPLYEGQRARLRSDLPKAEAEVFLARLETLELILDTAFPFVQPPKRPPLALVIADGARFSLHAQDHGVSRDSGAFACRGGELFLRYRAREWRVEGPPYPLEPRVRPLAVAALRRRLTLALGKELAPTWLEEGMALVFVELAAFELKDASQAVRQNRERLLDAFLPIYLGGPRGSLRKLLSAQGKRTMRRAGSPALAWAAVRFLSADPERTKLLELGLAVASGTPGRAAAWEQALASVDEDGFERFMFKALLKELLLAMKHAPTQVDRWEAAAALRLLANMDLDADASDSKRALQVAAAERMLAKQLPPVRFLDKFAGEIAHTRKARSRLRAIARLKKVVRHELARRTKGYGHPAIEAGRKDIGRALQRALRSE